MANISAVLQYWDYYLIAGYGDYLAVNATDSLKWLQSFFYKHSLYLLEVLSLLGILDAAIIQVIESSRKLVIQLIHGKTAAPDVGLKLLTLWTYRLSS